MTARIALGCDGTFDEGRMPCRGAIAFTVEQVADAAGMIGTDLVEVDAARELAIAAGWSATDAGDYCPSHTRRQAAALEAALADRCHYCGGPAGEGGCRMCAPGHCPTCLATWGRIRAYTCDGPGNAPHPRVRTVAGPPPLAPGEVTR